MSDNENAKTNEKDDVGKLEQELAILIEKNNKLEEEKIELSSKNIDLENQLRRMEKRLLLELQENVELKKKLERISSPFSLEREYKRSTSEILFPKEPSFFTASPNEDCNEIEGSGNSEISKEEQSPSSMYPLRKQNTTPSKVCGLISDDSRFICIPASPYRMTLNVQTKSPNIRKVTVHDSSEELHQYNINYHLDYNSESNPLDIAAPTTNRTSLSRTRVYSGENQDSDFFSRVGENERDPKKLKRFDTTIPTEREEAKSVIEKPLSPPQEESVTPIYCWL